MLNKALNCCMSKIHEHHLQRHVGELFHDLLDGPDVIRRNLVGPIRRHDLQGSLCLNYANQLLDTVFYTFANRPFSSTVMQDEPLAVRT